MLTHQLLNAVNPQLLNAVNPRKLACPETLMEGTVGLSLLSRVAHEVEHNPDGTDAMISVRLVFSRDEEGNYHIIGELKSHLYMICQRCLRHVAITIDAHVNVILAWSEHQANAFPKQLDALIVGDELILQDFIEDEILLNLPLVPCHKDKNCGIK